MNDGIKLEPIGKVRYKNSGICLELDKAYAPALSGLDGFSCLNVLWWANLLDNEENRSVLTCVKPYTHSPDSMGIFATRSPLRPNPVCLSVVSVSQIDYDNGVIYVPFIDAEDGTPIVDIKPYLPTTDRVRDASVPDWCSHWPQCLEDSAVFDWQAEFENAR